MLRKVGCEIFFVVCHPKTDIKLDFLFIYLDCVLWKVRPWAVRVQKLPGIFSGAGGGQTLIKLTYCILAKPRLHHRWCFEPPAKSSPWLNSSKQIQFLQVGLPFSQASTSNIVVLSCHFSYNKFLSSQRLLCSTSRSSRKFRRLNGYALPSSS